MSVAGKTQPCVLQVRHRDVTNAFSTLAPSHLRQLLVLHSPVLNNTATHAAHSLVTWLPSRSFTSGLPITLLRQPPAAIMRYIATVAAAIAACNAQYELQRNFAGESFFDNFVGSDVSATPSTALTKSKDILQQLGPDVRLRVR